MAKIKDHLEEYPLDRFGVNSPVGENPLEEMSALKELAEEIYGS